MTQEHQAVTSSIEVEQPLDMTRVTLQELCNSYQFDINRLDFDLARMRGAQSKAKIDMTGGFLTGTIFTLLLARAWPVLKPVNSVLYRNRFICPKLPDVIARLTNFYPLLCLGAMSYSFNSGTTALLEWREASRSMISNSVRIEERRAAQRALALRFDLELPEYLKQTSMKGEEEKK